MPQNRLSPLELATQTHFSGNADLHEPINAVMAPGRKKDPYTLSARTISYTSQWNGGLGVSGNFGPLIQRNDDDHEESKEHET